MLLVTKTIPIGFLITTYLLSVFVLSLNALRTLGAHRYDNAGGEVTFVEQLLDSVNYPRLPNFVGVWGAGGIAVPRAASPVPHAAVSQPGDGARAADARAAGRFAYRQTESPSLTASLVTLWRTSQAAGAATRQPAGHRPHQLTTAGSNWEGAQ